MRTCGEDRGAVHCPGGIFNWISFPELMPCENGQRAIPSSAAAGERTEPEEACSPMFSRSRLRIRILIRISRFDFVLRPESLIPLL